MIIHLVRHGQTKYNQLKRIQGTQDHPLTEEGVEDARGCALELSNKPIDSIFTSPLKRARDTAEIIGEKLGLTPEEDPRLKERFFGTMEGEYYDQVDLDYNFWDDLDQHYPEHGIETKSLMDERALSFFNEIHRRGFSEVVVVSHGAFIRSMLRILSEGSHDLMESYRVPHNGEILTLRWRDLE